MSKKTLYSKDCIIYLRVFLYENNFIYKIYKFSYKLTFSLFFPFLKTKIKNKFFWKLVVWQQKAFSFFCLQRVVLYYKGVPNLIDFYKGIFLSHVSVFINSFMMGPNKFVKSHTFIIMLRKLIKSIKPNYRKDKLQVIILTLLKSRNC